MQNSDLDISLSGYDYELPPELIAQNPVVPRDSSRLMVINSPDAGTLTPPLDHIFRDLPELLKPGDLLVMNNTRVIPARLYGRKSTGAKVEVLLLEEKQHNCWLALVKPGKYFNIGTEIIFDDQGLSSVNKLIPQLTATVIERDENTGGRLLQFDLPINVSLLQILHKLGEVPLPPYINNSHALEEQYQTVYAKHDGAVAAPTAGLHFTPELLVKLRECGIQQEFLTLHVGVGTFRPVEVEDVTTHQMHEEWIEVSGDLVKKIYATKNAGGRIIAVGTTVVRALEGAAQSGSLQPYTGKVNLFIYPGYQWRVVEGLITNFHLPRSSLLMLVSSLVGRERLLSIYNQAIASRYRFYSFGDAMLILPEARICCS
jgi:S-adenosylmethionine:tRNA ribosyltransferase-isomerase